MRLSDTLQMYLHNLALFGLLESKMVLQYGEGEREETSGVLLLLFAVLNVGCDAWMASADSFFFNLKPLREFLFVLGYHVFKNKNGKMSFSSRTPLLGPYFMACTSRNSKTRNSIRAKIE